MGRVESNMHELNVTKVYGKGKTSIPSEIRKRWKLTDGDRLVWMEDEFGKIWVKPSRSHRGRFQPVEEV